MDISTILLPVAIWYILFNHLFGICKIRFSFYKLQKVYLSYKKLYIGVLNECAGAAFSSFFFLFRNERWILACVKLKTHRQQKHCIYMRRCRWHYDLCASSWIWRTYNEFNRTDTPKSTSKQYVFALRGCQFQDRWWMIALCEWQCLENMLNIEVKEI